MSRFVQSGPQTNRNSNYEHTEGTEAGDNYNQGETRACLTFYH